MIALLSNGKYIKLKNVKKLNQFLDRVDSSFKRLNGIDYLLLNTDTATRTDVYTMIKGIQIEKGNPNNIEYVDMMINYSDKDSGYDPESNLEYLFKVNNIQNQFNIYPLVKQIADLNSYKDTVAELTENRMAPIDIALITKDKRLNWKEEDDDDITGIFKESNMKTCVRRLEDNYIILNKGKWTMTPFIPTEFDYIGYPIRDSENIQLISFDIFDKLVNLVELNIIVTIYNTQREYDEEEPNGVINIYATDVEEMLTHLFYLQTAMELDRYVSEPEMMYDVKLYISSEPNPYDFITNIQNEPRWTCIAFDDIKRGVSFYQRLSEIL